MDRILYWNYNNVPGIFWKHSENVCELSKVVGKVSAIPKTRSGKTSLSGNPYLYLKLSDKQILYYLYLNSKNE